MIETTDSPHHVDQIIKEKNIKSEKWRRTPWRMIAAVFIGGWILMFVHAARNGFTVESALNAMDWLVLGLLHLPYILILVMFTFGFVERIGYFWKGRAAKLPGRVPAELPKVCVQLPMFNEHAVAARLIRTAAGLDWPADKLVIQVLDDSTDKQTRDMVRNVCAQIQEQTGVTCTWLHRTDRTGYKAGALEAGRKQTDAEFIAIFDADFLPPSDYLRRAVPHFYNAEGIAINDLALVQAQWGHLNDDQSMLTGAQALWVDDHHTLQQSWRSAALGFVNFTGTAGLWRASAIEAAGGWGSASLVEDCELSFRVLFAGFRTKFVKEIVVPAELPQTFAAYRLQQKRWTQGWAQLQRLHLGTLLFRYNTPLVRKSVLTYLMCISWQWPLWMTWILIFPFLVANGLSLSLFGIATALLVYLGPPVAFALFSAFIATLETRHTYTDATGNLRKSRTRRFARLVPFLIVNAGMLPHHMCAFLEGLFGPMHSEFERTPKTANVTAAKADAASPATAVITSAAPKGSKRPGYLAMESGLFLSQISWIALFVVEGLFLAAIGAAWLASCIITIRLVPKLANTLRHFDRPMAT